MRKRPLGITLVSLLTFVAVAQYVVLFVLMFINSVAVFAYLHALSPGGSGPEKIHLAMGRFQAAYYAAMAPLTGLIGYGLWNLWNWTRLVILVMTGISLVGGLLTIPQLTHSGGAGAWALWAVRIILCVLWGWYLMSGRVRDAFHSPAAAQRQTQAA